VLSSLDEIKSRMKDGQAAIYYLTGESKKALLGSPHLEALRKRGYEVLLLTDPVDPFAIEGLREWEGTKIVNAAAADLDLGGATDEEKASQKDADDRTRNLRDRIRIRLQEHVKEVRASTRLVGSAAVLVVPEGELPPHVRRLLARAQQPLPEDKRILEINPEHPAIRALATLLDEKPIHPDLERFIDDLYTQALLAEGTSLEDPGAFARRFTDLLATSIEGARTS
jgi:molecular chaperone HtpG